MAFILADRVKETTSTTGTGTYTLAGASTGFESFASIGDGNKTYYCCTDGTDFEVGVGTYTASGTTLARTTILQSSNSDNAVSWTSGTRQIFCTLPAEKSIVKDDDGVISLGGSATTISSTAGNITIDAQGSDTDILLKGTTGGHDKTFLLLDGSSSGFATFSSGLSTSGTLRTTFGNVQVNSDGAKVEFGASKEVDLAHVHNTGLLLTNAGTGTPAIELQFVDSDEAIGSDGTNLLLTSGGNAITVPNSGADTMTLNAATQILTNKRLNLPKINEDVELTSTASELNLLDGVSGLVQADFTKLAAIDASAAELNYNDITTLGTVEPSKTVTADSSGNVTFPDGERIILGNTTAGDIQIYHAPLTTNTGVSFITSDSDFRIQGAGVTIKHSSGLGNITTTSDGVFVGGPLKSSGTLELQGGGIPHKIQLQGFATSGSIYDGVVYTEFIMMPSIGGGTGSLEIKCPQQDFPINFSGNDGGTTITALGLDFANNGRAVFRNEIALQGSTIDSNLTTITCVDPTASRTITLPNETGKINLSPAKKKHISQANFLSRNLGTAYHPVAAPAGYYNGQALWYTNQTFAFPWVINGHDDHFTVTIDEVGTRQGFSQSGPSNAFTVLVALFELNEYGAPTTKLYETTIDVPANVGTNTLTTKTGLSWSVKPGVYAMLCNPSSNHYTMTTYNNPSGGSYFKHHFRHTNFNARPGNALTYDTSTGGGHLYASTSPKSFNSTLDFTLFNQAFNYAPFMWWRYDTDL